MRVWGAHVWGPREPYIFDLSLYFRLVFSFFVAGSLWLMLAAAVML